MRRRGFRVEVDEPTEFQQRNSRWLAAHPVAVVAVAAVVFAGVGIVLALVRDDPWLTLPMGAAIGACFGALCGWGFATEQREGLTGARRAAYVAVCVLVFGCLLLLKILT